MWPRFGDIIVIYAVLTPLCVMYWHATFQMIDKYFNNNVTSALVGGYTMVVITILLHETLRCTAESFQYKCMYEYIYDYTVFTACLSYIHGCRLAYDIVRQSLTPIVIAILIGLFLIVMRGFRNILALPAVVNTDRLVDRYRPQNTLIFFGGVPGCIENDVFLASVIWPCIALLWEGVGEFLNGFNLDKYYMILYGYIAVAILQTLIKEIVEVFLLNNQCNTENNPEGAGPCNELLRVFVEDIYIAMTTTAVILIWKGLDKYAAAMISTIGMFIAPGYDVAVSQVIAFSLFWMFGVSMSLFSRQSNLDGDGVHFNTEVFC